MWVAYKRPIVRRLTRGSSSRGPDPAGHRGAGEDELWLAFRSDSDWYLRRCIRCRERIHTEDSLYCPHCGEFLGAG
jgi:hypothetical protein